MLAVKVAVAEAQSPSQVRHQSHLVCTSLKDHSCFIFTSRDWADRSTVCFFEIGNLSCEHVMRGPLGLPK